MSTLPRIGLTLGDASGIGPEIVAAAVHRADPALRRRLVLFGDGPIIDRAFAQITGDRPPAEVTVIDRGVLSADQAVPGRPSEAGARAQVGYLEAAVRAAKGGSVAGLVTAPINKHEARRAGFSFSGHTDFLAARFDADPVAMMFVGPTLRVVLATVHMPLATVAGSLSVKSLVATVTLAARTTRDDFGADSVHVGVVGLNPHAGERGLLGREEIEIIGPAVEECRRQLAGWVVVSGPLVPDVAFRRAAAGDYDVVVAMYHDQGLIPVKLLDFGRAVNVTLGLPIVRTSPEHGVAYDVAGTGEASAESFCAALDLAVTLVDRRAAAGDPAD